MAIHALQSGYILREYRIEKLLGEGGFGLTYLAFDTNLDKRVAIKEYMPSEHAVRKSDLQIVPKSESSEKVYSWGLNAFLNEAKTLAKFEDSNIVRVYRFFKANGTAYIVMEYCEGGCLIDRVSKNKHMDETELLKIMSAIVHGLQQVHNDGILHRDIKPDNIMFRQNGTPVLIDFGAARQAIGNKSRKVTTIITPGYAPLEQYSSKGSIGPWSDIYSLAAVAYLCLTGDKPPDIMNRLHDDTIIKLSKNSNSSPFLKSIDLGLELQVEERPKSLSEWSANWCQLKLQESKEFKAQNTQNPIYAIKNTKQSNNRLEESKIPQPISARSSLNPFEETIVNTNSIGLEDKAKFSFVRVFMTVFILIALAVGGLFGYDFYLKKQKQDLLIAQKIAQTKQQELQRLQAIKETTKQVQKALNQLGYTVPVDGNAGTRTLQSIKSFEKKHNLVITGTVDTILLQQLNEEINKAELNLWQQALQTNTIASYGNYLSAFPKGINADKAQASIEKIQLQDEAKQQEEEKQTIAENLVEQEIDKQQKNRLKQIALEKRLLIKDIQTELKRLKFKQLLANGEFTKQLKGQIIAFQKLKGSAQNGLPTKTLLFQLKSIRKWPGRLIFEKFTDCTSCPEMIVLPANNYTMGSNKGKANEMPQHNISIHEFAISTTEITFVQWDKCYEEGICKHRPDDSQLGRGTQAVMNINIYDIGEFLKWLKIKTGKAYHLPSESEWEYAARAGTTTNYSWGDSVGINHVSCNGCNTTNDNKLINHIKNYPANAFGLYDMHGNVWEWTQDCWHPNYSGAPSDNEAWEPNDCNRVVVRGGSGGNKPEDLRSSNRGVMDASKRLNSLGFRVALGSN
jgi:formylglycine-generating enzyme required for sulfatase activity/serine/threonine protein kinase